MKNSRLSNTSNTLHTSSKDNGFASSDSLLFSDRFQLIYQHLGVFGCMYVLRGNQGISKEEFLVETCLCPTGLSAVLSTLMKYSIILRRKGLLHLNRKLFYNLTLWDLLLICEPWLIQPPSGTDEDACSTEDYRKFREFASGVNISQSYIS